MKQAGKRVQNEKKKKKLFSISQLCFRMHPSHFHFIDLSVGTWINVVCVCFIFIFVWKGKEIFTFNHLLASVLIISTFFAFHFIFVVWEVFPFNSIYANFHLFHFFKGSTVDFVVKFKFFTLSILFYHFSSFFLFSFVFCNFYSVGKFHSVWKIHSVCTRMEGKGKKNWQLTPATFVLTFLHGFSLLLYFFPHMYLMYRQTVVECIAYSMQTACTKTNKHRKCEVSASWRGVSEWEIADRWVTFNIHENESLIKFT